MSAVPPEQPVRSTSLRDAWAELVQGSACVGCARPGRPLCIPCREALPRTAAPAWPLPVPPGLRTPYAAGPYDGVLRAMVLAHKEDGVLALAGPLGSVLHTAVAAALKGIPADHPVLLVPVPSRRAAVRRRGYDATHALARRAAAGLGADRPDVRVARLLRLRPGVADQAGLGAHGRSLNLHGSMAAPADRVRRLPLAAAHVILLDDVLTTGATAREGQRALEAAGIAVHAIATVAATRRLHPPGAAGGAVPVPSVSVPATADGPPSR